MDVFDLAAKLTLDSSNYESGLSSASNKTSSVSSTMSSTLAKIGTAVTAAFSVKAITNWVSEATSAGDTIDKMSQKLGMSASSYQEWDYVLNLAGSSMSEVSTGFKTLTNQIDAAKTGSEDAQGYFEALGISMEDLNGMSSEEAWNAVITGFQGLADTTERAALANDLLGRSGQTLAPLFNMTTEATQEAMQEINDLGGVMSDDSVAAAAEYNDAVTKLKTALGGIGNSIATSLMPMLTAVTDFITETVAPAFKKLSEYLSNIFSYLFGYSSGGSSSNSNKSMAESLYETADAAEAVAAAAEDATRQLMGFDEMTTLSSTSSGGGSGDGSGDGDGDGTTPITYESTILDDISEKADAASKAAEKLQGWIKSVQEWWEGLDTSNLKTAWDNLKTSFSGVADIISNALYWGYENVLKPLATWTIEEGLPALLDALAAGFDTLEAAFELIKPYLTIIWDDFLKPLADVALDAVVAGLENLKTDFENLKAVFTGDMTPWEWLTSVADISFETAQETLTGFKDVLDGFFDKLKEMEGEDFKNSTFGIFINDFIMPLADASLDTVVASLGSIRDKLALLNDYMSGDITGIELIEEFAEIDFANAADTLDRFKLTWDEFYSKLLEENGDELEGTFLGTMLEWVNNTVHPLELIKENLQGILDFYNAVVDWDVEKQNELAEKASIFQEIMDAIVTPFALIEQAIKYIKEAVEDMLKRVGFLDGGGAGRASISSILGLDNVTEEESEFDKFVKKVSKGLNTIASPLETISNFIESIKTAWDSLFGASERTVTVTANTKKGSWVQAVADVLGISTSNHTSTVTGATKKGSWVDAVANVLGLSTSDHSSTVTTSTKKSTTWSDVAYNAVAWAKNWTASVTTKLSQSSSTWSAAAYNALAWAKNWTAKVTTKLTQGTWSDAAYNALAWAKSWTAKVTTSLFKGGSWSDAAYNALQWAKSWTATIHASLFKGSSWLDSVYNALKWAYHLITGGSSLSINGGTILNLWKHSSSGSSAITAYSALSSVGSNSVSSSNAFGTGTSVIQIVLDGKVVGQTAVNYINGQAVATGVNPLSAYI